MPTLTYTSVEGTESLKALFVEDWFEEDGRREIYLRYYSMPLPPKDDFFIPGLDGDVVMFSGAPFRVAVAHVSGQEYKSHFPWLITSELGKPNIIVEEIKRVLPSANYVLISTPITDTSDQAIQNASALMDGFAGMLRLVGGNNLLRQLVREAAVDISSGNMKRTSAAVPVPHEIEGPFATSETWQQLEEVTDAIGTRDDAEGKRITFATQLVERAFSAQGPFKFFSYWVALEVAADAYGQQNFVNLLSNAYGRNNAYVQNDLGFQHVWETRTAVFHGGELYEMPYDVERYIQCLFLDVVRAKLGLDSQGYMAAAVQAGFDVTRLDRAVAQANILTIDGP